ncbi:MAG: HAD-IC family P-type ATPase [Clostridia bacterium]|nr:HAD-IC family P-type ATPase [Clostridia bacterium]
MTNKQIKKLNKVKTIDQLTVERYQVDAKVGLTAQQVQSRVDEGLVNIDNTRKSKSIGQIILSNLITFFNMVYLIITVLLVANGKWMQCTYLPVVFANTAIAIVQEIKSKLTLDKLKLITQPQIKVIRGGEAVDIAVDQLVLDDVVLLASGSQISADCVILDGFVEANESILTGESDAITKKPGDTLYAGSFVVSGSCTAQVKAIGKFNYIAGLTGRAKQYKKPRSQMLKALNTILIFEAIILVPMAIGLYIINVKSFGAELSWQLNDKALELTAGSIISMITAGPFLLTSVALGASFLRLAKNKTMVQELYCIEMLARVDTLCLDKTGTITDGTMQVVESIDLRPNSRVSYTVREIISSMNTALQADNMTSKALKKYFGSPRKPSMDAVAVVPFSSERKLSAVAFQGEGTYFLGAPEYVLKTQNQHVTDLVNKYAEQGLRVLLLAHSSTTMSSSSANLPQVRRPVAVIVIEDHIRTDAEETINWFRQNGVAIKIISGDNPSTVANIATRVGVEDADNYISLEGMTEEQVREVANKYTVFGRVSPDQKAILVKAMRQAGHTVSMTGDGVNDILAMKEADCSISLAGGSDAARQVAHLILMNDSFSSLPKVVAEGRRVVNNIQNTTSMFFMKTVYVIAINIMLLVMHFAFNQTMASPLTSLQVTLMDAVVVGIPSALLALQPNERIIEGNFLGNVLKHCFPAALTFIISTASLYA